MRLVTVDGFRSEARVITSSEPSHVHRVIESLVAGDPKDACGGVQNQFRVLFMAHDDACSVGVEFG